MKKHNPDYSRQFMVALKVIPESAVRPDGIAVHFSPQSFAHPAAHASSSSQPVRHPTTSSHPTMPTSSTTFGPNSSPIFAATSPHSNVQPQRGTSVAFRLPDGRTQFLSPELIARLQMPSHSMRPPATSSIPMLPNATVGLGDSHIRPRSNTPTSGPGLFALSQPTFSELIRSSAHQRRPPGSQSHPYVGWRLF
jgi:hypothetical protein